MDQDIDDEDLLSLSKRLLPFTSSHDHHSHRSIKSQQNTSFDQETLHENDTSLPTTANPGDIIKLNDGTRKKYNGSSWRRMCSKANCSYYTQSKGLCKPHLAALKKRKSSSNKDDHTSSKDQILVEHEETKTDEIINNIRKKYDGRQYRRLCADPTCMTVVHDSADYQNGFCPDHYEEFRDKNVSESKSSTSLVSSSSRKRRRPKSSSSIIPSQVPMSFDIQTSLSKSNHRLSIVAIPPSVDINNPKKGDIIEMENGSRKKFDGVVWRKICSLPGCFIAAQRNELCRKHFIKLNGKPNNALTMVTSVSRSYTSVDEKSGSGLSEKVNDVPIDYDNEHEEPTNDHTSDDNTQQNGHYHETSSTIDENHFDILSTTRQKFPTNHLKQWLRDHRHHPYPNNQEKLHLAKQSLITYDQVTTWFNNTRAILRRHQTKLEHSSDILDDNGDSFSENDEYSDSNRRVSSKSKKTENENSVLLHQSFPLFDGIYCRSIGVQCTPSTVNQTTSTSTNVSSDDLTSDRTIRVLFPSSHVLKTINSIKRSTSEEFLINGIKTEDDNDVEVQKEQDIIITTTCLDDNQMTRVREFCRRFQIKFSHLVDEYTTHLITDEEADETLVCPLSKKVIQAIARHMYILTYRWIDTCLKVNQIIYEKPFEIQGDLTLASDHHGMQRSRQAMKSLLLESFSIILKCDGCQEMLNHDELIELVQLSGANYTIDSHFSRLPTGRKRVVLCEKEYLIHRKEMYQKCLHAGVHFLTPEWFLESIVQYRIQPFQEYQISP